MNYLLVVLWVAGPLVISALDQPEIILASTTAQNLADGLALVLDNRGTTDFVQKLSTTFAKVAPFLSGFGYGLSFFLSFIPTGDSEELAYMKEQFAIIKEKLEEISQGIDELSDAVDWSSYETNFGQLESKIRAMYTGLMEIEAYENWTTAATHWHTQSGDDIDAGLQFYQGITEEGIFNSEKLFTAAARLALDYDRTATQGFMLRCVELVTMAATVDISYMVIDAKLDGREVQNVDAKSAIWDSRMDDIDTEVAAADEWVVSQANSRLTPDVNAAISLMGSQSKHTFFNYLSDKLIEKYFWRDVFVVVYNDVSGQKHHCYYDCEPPQYCFKKFGFHNKNLIVIVEDKTYTVRAPSCQFNIGGSDYNCGGFIPICGYDWATEIYHKLSNCYRVTKMTMSLDSYPIVYNGNAANTPRRRLTWHHYTKVIAFHFG